MSDAYQTNITQALTSAKEAFNAEVNLLKVRIIEKELKNTLNVITYDINLGVLSIASLLGQMLLLNNTTREFRTELFYLIEKSIWESQGLPMPPIIPPNRSK